MPPSLVRITASHQGAAGGWPCFPGTDLHPRKNRGFLPTRGAAGLRYCSPSTSQSNASAEEWEESRECEKKLKNTQLICMHTFNIIIKLSWMDSLIVFIGEIKILTSKEIFFPPIDSY